MSQHGLRDPAAPPPANVAPVLWSDARLLGFGPMDATHEEFYEVAFRLLTCTEEGMLQALDDFEAHAREHFEQEDGWMRSTGFPPRECHMREHEYVLESIRQVRDDVAGGRAGLQLVHALAGYLFQWFPGHADYLDSALAAWMSKRTLGGKPIVLRRTLKF
jgi:hemerythrin-like metal-binding protein